jgi:hypothetical protein
MPDTIWRRCSYLSIRYSRNGISRAILAGRFEMVIAREKIWDHPKEDARNQMDYWD